MHDGYYDGPYLYTVRDRDDNWSGTILYLFSSIRHFERAPSSDRDAHIIIVII